MFKIIFNITTTKLGIHLKTYFHNVFNTLRYSPYLKKYFEQKI